MMSHLLIWQVNMNVKPEVQSALDTRFSCTTDAETVAKGISIMACLKDYFTYEMRYMCTFSYIAMKGTLEDWQRLQEKALEIVALSPTRYRKKWGEVLAPVLNKFVEEYKSASRNEPSNEAFWNSMVLPGGYISSGGWNWIGGWILAFFPGHPKFTLHDQKPWSADAGFVKARNDPDSIPSAKDTHFGTGLSIADVIFNRDHLGKPEVGLKFISGFMGVTEDEHGIIEPVIGWTITAPEKASEE